MCRINLLSEVFYSACLPPALLPNSCRLLSNSEFISEDYSVLSCRTVSVLVLLDVTDTDKPGIYSTLWFLQSIAFTQGEPASLPVSSVE